MAASRAEPISKVYSSAAEDTFEMGSGQKT